MTTGKRALIVDDSRSARVILSRMLEQHGLAVDTAESAEQALEYLQQSRPDVIFMDHLMPGMDGFQAVQAIKAEPRTATIPLMMYTSQEGELYVSQARALGAVGVLPKTVRPVDVSRILYQLHLLPDRRSQRSALFDGETTLTRIPTEALSEASGSAPASSAPIEAAPGTAVPAPAAAVPAQWSVPPVAFSEMQAALRQSLQQLVKDQLSEHRRFMLATFEAFARRMGSELKEGLARIPVPPVMEPVPPPPPRQWWPVALTALLAAVPATVVAWMLWQATESNAQLAGEVARLQAEQAATKAAAALAVTNNLPPVNAAPPRTAGPVATEFVPYGEAPLAAGRLDRLRGIAATLEAQHFRGTIHVETFVGDFCLTGNSGDGFSVADSDLPSQKCDLVGNPFDDTLSAAQRQSVAFANFVATLRQRTGGAIGVEVVNVGRRSVAQYPEQGDKTTAGQWNAIAAQNNRVEFRIVPAA